jgi:hypothetical protein
MPGQAVLQVDSSNLLRLLPFAHHHERLDVFSRNRMG